MFEIGELGDLRNRKPCKFVDCSLFEKSARQLIILSVVSFVDAVEEFAVQPWFS